MRYIGTFILFAVLFDLYSQDSYSQENYPRDSISHWQEIYHESSENYQFDKAIEAAENWVKADTSNTTALFELSSIYAKAGIQDKALKTLQALLLIDSLHIPGLNQLARLHTANGTLDAALNAYEKLMAADSTNGYFVKKAASILLNQKRQEYRTYIYMEKALDLNPTDINLRIDAARFFMDRRAFYPADTLLAGALLIDSTHQAARLVSAQSAFLQKDYDHVVELLKGFDSDSEYFLVAARYYGISLFYLEDYSRAIDVFKTISLLDEKADYPYYYTGLSYVFQKKPAEAIEAFETAIEKATSPNLAMYYQQLGQAQKSVGQFEKAIVNLKQAQFLNEDKEILFQLAESYDSYFADKTIALKMYASYLELDTVENENTLYARSRMDEIAKELHFKRKEE